MWSFNKVVHSIPFLRIVFLYVIGIWIVEYFSDYISAEIYFISAGILSVLIFCSFWVHGIKKDRNFSIIIALVLIGAGVLFSKQKKTEYIETSMKIDVACTVQRIEKTNDKQTTILVRSDVSLDTINKKPICFLLHVKDTTMQEVLPGYKILVQGVLFPFEKVLNPEQFDYRKYMLSKGISHQCFIHEQPKVLIESPKQIRVWAALVQYRLLKRLEHPILKEEHYSVIAALVLGNKTFLDKDLRKSYASAGAMHVLAVSGLHVGIIFLILNNLLFFLNRRKKGLLVKACVIIIFLWAYAFITGLSPSVMRSATMFSIVSVGVAYRKQSNIYNTIFISVFLLLLINPQLIFDVGFQLSYSAVLSIVFFQPKIVSIFTFRSKLGSWLWQLFAVSLAAQLGTFPIAIFYFHQLPVFFWLSNFLVIPMAGVLIYASVAYLLFANVAYVSMVLIVLLKGAISILNYSVTTIENLPCAVIENIMVDRWLVFLSYGIIVTAGFLLVSKNRRFVHLIVLLLCILIFKQLYVQWERKDQQKIVIYYHYKNNEFSFLYRQNSIHFTDNEEKKLPIYVVQNGVRATGDIGEIHYLGNKISFESEEFSIEKVNDYYFLINLKSDKWDKKRSTILYYTGKPKYFKWPLGDISQIVSKYELNINCEISVHCLCVQGCYVLDMR